MRQATGLEYILGGGSISTFDEDAFPTIRDVLRFYSQFWREKKSANIKETRVAEALEQFYYSKGITTICQINIKRKIKKEIGNLTKILKFKSKKKNENHIRLENEFKADILNVFTVEKTVVANSATDENTEIHMDEDSSLDENMDIEGILD